MRRVSSEVGSDNSVRSVVGIDFVVRRKIGEIVRFYTVNTTRAELFSFIFIRHFRF